MAILYQTQTAAMPLRVGTDGHCASYAHPSRRNRGPVLVVEVPMTHTSTARSQFHRLDMAWRTVTIHFSRFPWEDGHMLVDTATKELLFTTVRIRNEEDSGRTTTGTGFMMSKVLDDKKSAPFMVTNKHVVQDAKYLTLEFIARNPAADAPLLGVSVDQRIEHPELYWVGHPDPNVDVAVFSTSKVIADLDGKIYFRSMPTDLMLRDGDGIFIDAVEEITFIGYPNGHRDPVNLTPIVRRGITATPLELAFDGKPAFLVDGSVFGGSSGSPAFLLNVGMYRSGPHAVSPGTRRALVGVVAATIQRTTNLPVVVGHGPHVKLAKELNLGIIYNCRAIDETISVFLESAGLAAGQPNSDDSIEAGSDTEIAPADAGDDCAAS